MKTLRNEKLVILATIALILLPIALSKAFSMYELCRLNKKECLLNKFNPDYKYSTEFTVSSKSAWQDTGILINKGDVIKIKAAGTIYFDTAGRKANPDGEINPNQIYLAQVDDKGRCNYLLCKEKLHSFTLVGRIGNPELTDSTNGFFVGSDFSVTAADSGNLYLGFNDGFVKTDRSGLDSGAVADNSDEFAINIIVKPKRKE